MQELQYAQDEKSRPNHGSQSSPPLTCLRSSTAPFGLSTGLGLKLRSHSCIKWLAVFLSCPPIAAAGGPSFERLGQGIASRFAASGRGFGVESAELRIRLLSLIIVPGVLAIELAVGDAVLVGECDNRGCAGGGESHVSQLSASGVGSETIGLRLFLDFCGVAPVLRAGLTISGASISVGAGKSLSLMNFSPSVGLMPGFRLVRSLPVRGDMLGRPDRPERLLLCPSSPSC